MLNIILGFDFGLSRIGVAVGQSVTQSTTALSIGKRNAVSRIGKRLLI